MRIKLLLLITTLISTAACLPAQTIHEAKIVQEGYQDDSLGTGILLELDLPEMPAQKGPIYLQAWTQKVVTPEYSSNSASNSSYDSPSFGKTTTP